MPTVIPIDASKARSNFFNILQRVYEEGETFVVKKAGIPMATIKTVSSDEKSKRNIMDFAGAWKKAGVDAPNLIKHIYESRKDRPEHRRKLPSFT